MKEHPDYKYRPRRKPKPLMKKEPKFGFPISPLISPSLENHQMPRTLMPPISAHAALPPLLSHDPENLKISRTLFPPLPYLYPFRHPDDSKFATELALLYSNNPLYPSGFNWSLGNLTANMSGPCSICPPTFTRRSPSPEAMKRPVCVIMKNDEFRNDPVPAHVIWKPLPVLPERLNLNTYWNNIAVSSHSNEKGTMITEREDNSSSEK